MTITDDMLSALRILSSAGNGRGLLPAAHAIINRNVSGLLANGLITYAPNGYKVTATGRAAIG